jgi:methylenetetrahydrofolate dehydrogenase (NADP+)/methenyltetrahydrofolate cyclohydrolase
VENEGITLPGAHACVVGQGLLVGVPIARWLESEGAVVDRVDDTSAEPAAVCSQADLVVAGAGVPSLVTGEWIRQGAAVFDFGYAKKDGVFVGDVDAPSVVKKAGLMSPVPGGMGPLVVAAVLQNVLTLALHQPKR